MNEPCFYPCPCGEDEPHCRCSHPPDMTEAEVAAMLNREAATMNEPTLTDTERVREVLADHFVMWFELSRLSGPPGEWRCQCGLKFGFSDSAIDHQASVVAACVVEAVDRERAAWVAKIETLADEWQRNAAANERAGHFPWAMWQNRANELRALLAADTAK